MGDFVVEASAGGGKGGIVTNSGGGEGDGEGAAGLISEAWLVTVIVRLRCQPWQWNMISPLPPPPLNQSWVSLWRGGGERCSARAALLRWWWWWFGGWDGIGGAVKRSVPHGS